MTAIAILETGRPPAHLAEAFGDYTAQFRAMLGEGATTHRFDVQAGELPEDPSAFVGTIVTGSAAGVYEDLPWIEPLSAWLREARGKTRLVGVCFGHQIWPTPSAVGSRSPTRGGASACTAMTC